MLQKTMLSRAPLMDAVQSPLSRGTVRTGAEELKKLYTRLSSRLRQAETLEAAFSLSCLLKNEPMKEKPAAMLLQRLQEKRENGSFQGTLQEQLSIARGGLALFEYCMDQALLKRLAEWCRYLEAGWEEMEHEFLIRVQAADLMEFLVRFYRISGIKAILRLCTKLRSASMDWTSYLHNEKRRGTVETSGREEEIRGMLQNPVTGEFDFFQIQYYMNHAELAADGIRFCAWSGLFSGNSQDLSAGRDGWEQIQREHRAACGGTTGAPFFAGSNTAGEMTAGTVAAWVEAMTAQSLLTRDPWVMNELTVLVKNALPAAIRTSEKSMLQRVNTIAGTTGFGSGMYLAGSEEAERLRMECRLARAAAAAYQYAITLTGNEISVNYLLEGKYGISGDPMPAVLRMSADGVSFQNAGEKNKRLTVFISDTEDAEPMLTDGRNMFLPCGSEIGKRGMYLRIDREWKKSEGILFRSGKAPILKAAHHQGVCCYHRSRLMALDAGGGEFRFAAAGEPVLRDGQVLLPVRKTEQWKTKDYQPNDIPVRPKTVGETELKPLVPYDETICRIAVFPKAAEYE